MFLMSFRITGTAVAQILILGAIGYILIRKNVLSQYCLDAVGQLVINVTLPFLIFCQLIKGFSFTKYPDWWIYPLISGAITLAGLGLGWLFSAFIKGGQHKLQFISLVTFQNSGYLPLALAVALLSPEKQANMLVYLFLLLLGFNLIMFSFGTYLLTFEKAKRFKAATIFSPPVIATLIGLVFVYFGWNRHVANLFYMPFKSIGDCTVPLAIFVVGGSLAQIKLKHIDKKAMTLMILAKLIILPALGILLIARFKLPELIGLMILMQLAMPPATTLSTITVSYKKEDFLISQGIFVGHIASIITIPLFLSLYFVLSVLQ